MIRNRLVVPRTAFYSWHINEALPEFAVVATRDNRLFGIVTKAEPSRVHAMIDFAEGKSWPRDEDSLDWASKPPIRAAWDKQFQLLREDNPHLTELAE